MSYFKKYSFLLTLVPMTFLGTVEAADRATGTNYSETSEIARGGGGRGGSMGGAGRGDSMGAGRGDSIGREGGFDNRGFDQNRGFSGDRYQVNHDLNRDLENRNLNQGYGYPAYTGYPVYPGYPAYPGYPYPTTYPASSTPGGASTNPYSSDYVGPQIQR